MMAVKKLGAQSVVFQNPPVIAAASSVAGPKEGQGPFGPDFDLVLGDTLNGQKSWEKAETQMLLESVKICLKKAGIKPESVDFLLAGDLLNQITCANLVARDISIPFFGLYGACSTYCEGMALGAMMVDGGFAERVAVCSSSHHNTAERQYRYPTEFGAQRCPTAQWTVTGAGAALISAKGSGPRITHATVGRVVDMGLKDVNDMGSAMAPAAADTIKRHFSDTGRRVSDYDAILTGDLGCVGKAICEEMLRRDGLDLGGRYDDCGVILFRKNQDVHAGGSGCACAALVFAARLMAFLKQGKYRRALLVATGALHSPTSCQQGEAISCVAHAVSIECEGGGS